jgi:hypothetical protein
MFQTRVVLQMWSEWFQTDSPKCKLMLDSRVLCDQRLKERMQQRFASLSNIVHKLESFFTLSLKYLSA